MKSYLTNLGKIFFLHKNLQESLKITVFFILLCYSKQ